MDYNGEEPVQTGAQHVAAAHHKFTLFKALALVVGALLFCGIGVYLGVTQGPAVIRDVRIRFGLTVDQVLREYL